MTSDRTPLENEPTTEAEPQVPYRQNALSYRMRHVFETYSPATLSRAWLISCLAGFVFLGGGATAALLLAHTDATFGALVIPSGQLADLGIASDRLPCGPFRTSGLALLAPRECGVRPGEPIGFATGDGTERRLEAATLAVVSCDDLGASCPPLRPGLAKLCPSNSEFLLIADDAPLRSLFKSGTGVRHVTLIAGRESLAKAMWDALAKTSIQSRLHN